jgi:RNA polymerase sigma-70 factor (ECF subfamily)
MSSADRRTQDGERLVELLGPFHAQAAGVARRLARSTDDGDDLFQEAVLRALDALPTLRDASRFRSWFFAILLRVHRNRSRRSFWRRFLPLEAEPSEQPVGDDGQAWEEERIRARRVSRALGALPAEQREAIVLFDLEGFSVEEVAALQQASVSAVKSRLSRGRARLRRIYERWGFGTESSRARAERVVGLPAPVLAEATRSEEGRP